jgi:hypothetical protein
MAAPPVMDKVRENARRAAVMDGATGFAGARVGRVEPGIMCPSGSTAWQRGQAWWQAGRTGSTELLGAAIGDGTAIGQGQGVGVAQHAEKCGFESFFVCGHGRADGRALAGRRW